MPITWMGCAPGNFQRGRPAGFRPEAIVVHSIGGLLQNAAAKFFDPRSRTSAHYGVRRDGTTQQYVNEEDTAFHAGVIVMPSWRLLRRGVNPNFYTIGVEHEGAAGMPWDDALYDASATLIGTIARRWSIPVDRDHIITHQHIRASRECPGAVVEMDRLVEIAKAKAAEPPRVFSVAPTVRLLTMANLRVWPSKQAPIIRVLSPDMEPSLASTGIVEGQATDGNAFWYVIEDGYLWAGGTNIPNPMARPFNS